MKQISKVILANCFQGQKKEGVGLVERNLGKLRKTLLKDYDVSTIPTRDFNTKKGYNSLAEQVHQNHVNHHKTLTIGGDHSIAIGSLQGSLNYYKDNLTAVWVDAHADLNTFASSPSGNLHGMPLGFLTGLETNFIQEPYEKLSLDNLKFLGIRDLDEFERKTIVTHGVQHLSSEDINNGASLDEVQINTSKIHLSLDVDVLDPKYMNSTGTRVKEGITMEKLEEIIDWVNDKGDIVSVDLVEFNPKLTPHMSNQEKDRDNYGRILEKILEL